MSELATRPTGNGPAPSGLAEQVQWLVDRAAISDLLVEFARSLDEKDWAAHVELYLPDGVFMAGDVFRLEGHEELIGTASPQALGQYAATWHLSANHAIHLDGDTARVRSYLAGVHLLEGAGPTGHADGGGWYDSTMRRTPEGWRLETVRVTEVWRAGAAMPHVSPPPAAS
jgi:ketosteroid isomerase-like protein